MGNGIVKHVDISIIVPLCTETSTIKYCSHRILVRRILAGFPNNSGRPAEISQQKSPTEQRVRKQFGVWQKFCPLLLYKYWTGRSVEIPTACVKQIQLRAVGGNICGREDKSSANTRPGRNPGHSWWTVKTRCLEKATMWQCYEFELSHDLR